MMAVLSTEAEAMKFPSVAQHISYTSSRWPLGAQEKKEGRKERQQTVKNVKANSGTVHLEIATGTVLAIAIIYYLQR